MLIVNEQQVAFIIKVVQVIDAVLTLKHSRKRPVCTEISKGLSGSHFFSVVKGNTLMDKERPSELVTFSYTFQ